ncbi:MAG: DUF3891 family protein [Planctomycetales bacterium]
MIRRTTSLADGTDGWILISQVQHAQLAGQILRNWSLHLDSDLASVWNELLEAVFHHDDGWTEWQQKVDPKSGWPLDFLEMPLHETLAIWTRSINLAENIGGLSAYIVAGHFTQLLQPVLTQSAGGQVSTVRNWCAEMSEARKGWLANWQSQNESVHTIELAEKAVRILKAFDAASLWFCCQPVSPPHVLQSHIGPPVVMTQDSETQSTGIQQPGTQKPGTNVVVSPWPFQMKQVSIEAEGHQMKVARFDRTGDFDNAAKQPISLHWTLKECPSSEGIE